MAGPLNDCGVELHVGAVSSPFEEGALRQACGRRGRRLVGLRYPVGERPLVDSPRSIAAAASSVLLAVSSLVKICEKCVFTVPRLMKRRAPICGLVRPSGTRATTSSSVGVRFHPP